MMKRNEMKMENIPTIITACCILHNFCETHGNAFRDSWLDSTINTEYQQPTSSPMGGFSSTSSTSNEVRNTLMEYFFQQND